MSKKQKKTLVRIILSAVLLVAAALIPVDGIVKLVLFLIPYAVIGWDVLGRPSATLRMARCSMKTS